MTTTPTTISARALAAVPGLNAHDQAIETLDRRITELQKPWDAAAERRTIVADTVDQLLAGDDVPTDLGRRLLALEAGGERRAELAELSTLAPNLRAQRDGLIRRHAAGVFGVLAGELDRLLDDVRTVDATLGPIASADVAIKAGPDTAEAWNRLGELVQEHDEIRRVQRGLVKLLYSGLHHWVTVFEDAGVLRNLIDLDPEYRERITGQPQPGGPPWPSDDTAYLRWLVASEAEPWLPTYDELIAHWEAMRQAVSTAAAERAPKRTPAEKRLRRLSA